MLWNLGNQLQGLCERFFVAYGLPIFVEELEVPWCDSLEKCIDIDEAHATHVRERQSWTDNGGVACVLLGGGR